jgi:hypothetical protein
MRLDRIGAFLGLVLVLLMAVACSGAGLPANDNGGDRSGDEPQPGATSAPQAPGDPDQLIVYTGSMTLEVAELRPAMDQAQQIVAGMGGHLAGSSLEDYEGTQYARVTYRIPSERWSDALQQLRALGTKVLAESTESEDVTEQVVDIEARIANLRVTETAFQGFMDRATTIEVLQVQRSSAS